MTKNMTDRGDNGMAGLTCWGGLAGGGYHKRGRKFKGRVPIPYVEVRNQIKVSYAPTPNPLYPEGSRKGPNPLVRC